MTPFSLPADALSRPGALKGALEQHFGSDARYGIAERAGSDPADCEPCARFPDGSHAAVCTNYALAVYSALATTPQLRCRLVWIDEHRSPSAHIAREHEGHDFCMVNDRFLIDAWARNVGEYTASAVLDIEDPGDAAIVADLYGDVAAFQQNLALEQCALSVHAKPAHPVLPMAAETEPKGKPMQAQAPVHIIVEFESGQGSERKFAAVAPDGMDAGLARTLANGIIKRANAQHPRADATGDSGAVYRAIVADLAAAGFAVDQALAVQVADPWDEASELNEQERAALHQLDARMATGIQGARGGAADRPAGEPTLLRFTCGSGAEYDFYAMPPDGMSAEDAAVLASAVMNTINRAIEAEDAQGVDDSAREYTESPTFHIKDELAEMGFRLSGAGLRVLDVSDYETARTLTPQEELLLSAYKARKAIAAVTDAVSQPRP